MATFDIVNYSLRPSKSIQRGLVFDDARRVQLALTLENLLYVGFGSIWFTDFVLAHRTMRIPELISIEADPIGFTRASFNKPFANVSVENGLSSNVLPLLYSRPALIDRPWMMWLDYDKELSETIVSDIRKAIESLPPNSMLIVTFNSVGFKYGQPKHRQARVADLLGDVVPEETDLDSYQDDALPGTLADLTLDFMKSCASSSGRNGGFVPAFRLPYQDGAAMVTVGGILPTPKAHKVARALVNSGDWGSLAKSTIVAPHLTPREAATLQAKLPSLQALDRAAVQALGFDLEEGQIAAFQQYYRFYPSFAQIIS